MESKSCKYIDSVDRRQEVDEAVARVFSLFRSHGKRDYVGESVSQSEHMLQCAMLAESDGQPPEIVLAALFHDIGHLLAFEDAKIARMTVLGEAKHSSSSPTKRPEIMLGVHRHEQLGANFLERLGFPKRLCAIVEAHVDAKRYLVYADPLYEKRLSEASKQTLKCQGGPMTAEEARQFESEGHFQAAIKLRYWDERGKVAGLQCEPLEKYETMCRSFLQSVACAY